MNHTPDIHLVYAENRKHHPGFEEWEEASYDLITDFHTLSQYQQRPKFFTDYNGILLVPSESHNGGIVSNLLDAMPRRALERTHVVFTKKMTRGMRQYKPQILSEFPSQAELEELLSTNV